MGCTGTIPFSVPSILFDGVTETTEDVGQLVKQVFVIRTLSSIFVYMCDHGLTFDNISRNAFLIRAYGCDDANSPRVELLATVADDTDHYFLPNIFTPGLAAIALA